MIDIEKALTNCDNEKNHHGLILRESYFGYQDWFKRYREGDKSLDPNLKGMIDNKLTEDEAFFILAYTGSCSSWINSRLRDGTSLDSECKKYFADCLDQVLDKIPTANGEIVFRMDLPGNENEILAWFDKHKGRKIRIPYFLSTAKEDYNNTNIVWEILTLKKNSKGKDISNLSNNQFEKEVLFKRNSCFKVDHIDQSKNYVHLVEIPICEKINFDLVGLYHLNIK
jgi:hypothetical protein